MTMALTRYNRGGRWPSLLDNFPFSFFDDDFVGGLSANVPSRGMDISVTKDKVLVQAPVYGVDPKDVSVNVEGNTLTVKGESKQEKNSEAEEYYSSMKRSFYYSTTLPVMVNADKAEAKVKNGIVTVEVPRTEESKGKTIKVTAE
jgi:HSP20 family protein